MLSLSYDLQQSIVAAIACAKRMRNDYAMPEHLALMLLDDVTVRDALIALRIDINDVRIALLSQMPDEGASDYGSNEDPPVNQEFQYLIEKAAMRIITRGEKRAVYGVDVLLEILCQSSSYIADALRAAGLTVTTTRLYIRRATTTGHYVFSSGLIYSPDVTAGTSADDDNDDSISDEQPPATTTKTDSAWSRKQLRHTVKLQRLLREHTTNLCQQARAGRLDPVIGRDDEVARLWQILARRSKNNALLLGDSGVGKTALVHGLARAIVAGRAPTSFADSVVLSLDIGSLVAGTKYRGDFEDRLRNLIKAFAMLPMPIVFIDEIHTIIGAGAVSGQTMDAANLLKPILTGGTMRCIGATTWQEYHSVLERHAAINRRFQRLTVNPTTPEQTLRIINQLAPRYATHHDVTYSSKALQAAVTLADSYISEPCFPDKAIDVLDEAGAYNALRNRRRVTAVDIQQVVARIARLPLAQIKHRSSNKDGLVSLQDRLSDCIYGQLPAIIQVVNAIKRSRAGLGEANKPVGSFLFVGPTGVGKTELAVQLAAALGIDFIRFDMSEFAEGHAVSKLIGSPPGYIGHDRGGALTDAIRKKPHTVLLLDEIEKAHPDMYNLLLQVMDNGVLTDNHERSSDFRHTIIIMTSNIGSNALAREGIGFVHSPQDGEVTRAVQRFFTPEFRNRLSAVVSFAPLQPDTISRIVDACIDELRERLQSRQVTLTLDDEARQWFVTNGYDRLLGARPMRRLIADTLHTPLADALLFGGLQNGGHVHVSVDDNEAISIDYRDANSVHNDSSVAIAPGG